jgi:hypothetical protein
VSRARSAAILVAALSLTGCTSPATPSAPVDRTVTRTVTGTRTPPATFTPTAAHSVRPLAPTAKAARVGRSEGAVERRCPYIAASQDESQVSVADIVGDHVYRTVVLTDYRPVGCRFYFYAPPYEAVADIVPTTFATARAAHNALVLTARAGTEQISEPNFVKGIDGICYRTRFFGPDGARDWAFAFAKGRVLVVVHTQRSDTSRNGLYLAQAIAKNF